MFKFGTGDVVERNDIYKQLTEVRVPDDEKTYIVKELYFSEKSGREVALTNAGALYTDWIQKVGYV